MQPFSGALREISTIPGARYCCVADGDTGVVLAEHGPADPDPGAAVRWGARLSGVLGAGDLEDVMITAERTFHLLRRVPDGPRVLLLHVSVDREHGTLAGARRALGNVDLTRPPDGPTNPSPPAYSPASTRPPTLPTRTPRRPDPALPLRTPGAATAPGSPLSAVPPPRSPAPDTRPRPRPATAPGTAPAPAPPAGAPATAPPPLAIPEARGWSDDLYTMRRLLDGLRRMP